MLYSRFDIPAALQGIPGVPDSGNDAGEVLVDGIARDFRNPDGSIPAWAEYQIQELYHSAAIEAGDVPALVGSFGNDYIAGGAGHDVIFGQLGDDTIQGDGSIDGAIELGKPVGAVRTQAGSIDLTPTLTGLPNNIFADGDFVPSFEAATDGDDYIEGNGGNDVIFGNLGQDDIIGGSSEWYTLISPDLRPDGADMIFGGSGQRADHGHDVSDGNRDTIILEDVHARDADAIAGDNANIYRILGINGAEGDGVDAANGDEFLAFEYDKVRGAQRIIVRAVELIDYTPGGPDYNAAGAATDIGAGDEIHGESGDDFIYGMKGADVLFGDSENDDLIGGWGPDWISGGTGSDGVIGDDGRILTARYVPLGAVQPDPGNLAHYAEPLNGVFGVDELNKEISTPGDVQRAVIHPTEIVDGQSVGQIFKTVDLTPFNLDPNSELQDRFFEPLYANDIIFGGLGNDFLHGSAGDDAISGAEALPQFFAAPINPDDPQIAGDDLLRYDAEREEFADYDENNPRSKLVPFLLNFDPAGDPDTDETADNHFDTDAIFGDLGNDWLVGGPDNDNIFGGFGDDLLNADDDLTTNNGLNDMADQPDIDSQDLAFGGAGRDVLIANTGGDRLIDWVGEFNSFLTPFGPFGASTVSRGVPPHLIEFLYELSGAVGADPTRVADTGNLAERNAEPDGEIGLVTQNDQEFWQDQSGAPNDPQPGNVSGGQRLTLRGVDLDSGAAEASEAEDTGFFDTYEPIAYRPQSSDADDGDTIIDVKPRHKIDWKASKGLKSLQDFL